MTDTVTFPIVFDLDGTLFDCKDLTNQTFPHVLDTLEKRYGDKIKIQRKNGYEQFLGMVEKEIFAELLPGADMKIVEEAKEELINIEMELIPKAGRLFDGTIRVLEELKGKGYPLFIASNGSKPYVRKVLDDFSITSYFTGVYSAGEHKTESKTDLVEYLLKEQCLNAPGIMAGDRHSDIEAGRVNGLYTVGCLYGFGGKEETEGADLKIKKVEEMLEAVKRGEQEGW